MAEKKPSFQERLKSDESGFLLLATIEPAIKIAVGLGLVASGFFAAGSPLVRGSIDDSHLTYDWENITEQALPQFGVTTGTVSDEFNTSQTFHVPGTKLDLPLPPTAVSVRFMDAPLMVQNVGTGMDAYKFNFGPKDEQGRQEITAILNTKKLAFNAFFLDKYGVNANDVEDEDSYDPDKSYIIVEPGAATKIVRNRFTNEWDLLQGLCSGTLGRLDENIKGFCDSVFGAPARGHALYDAKVLKAARIAALNKATDCMDDLWGELKIMYEQALIQMAIDQLDLTEEQVAEYVTVKFVGPEKPDFTKSTLDMLAKSGYLTPIELADLGYENDDNLTITCNNNVQIEEADADSQPGVQQNSLPLTDPLNLEFAYRRENVERYGLETREDYGKAA